MEGGTICGARRSNHVWAAVTLRLHRGGTLLSRGRVMEGGKMCGVRRSSGVVKHWEGAEKGGWNVTQGLEKQSYWLWQRTAVLR